MTEFKPWPKTPRLFRDIVITEKIDGTNAAIQIERDEAYYELGDFPYNHFIDPATGLGYRVTAQSRNRLIYPGDDNFGFAAWVRTNGTELVAVLGEGCHYGEWWGSGIQRGYGLTKGEKRFSLFNVNRYRDADLSAVPGLGVVPVLGSGMFTTGRVDSALLALVDEGSSAAPGFMRPEGIVVYHTAARSVFKVLLDNDDVPKGAAA
jgi:hypothetical protein